MKKKKSVLTEKDKPEITYPCKWQYKIIGKSRPDLESAVQTICNNITYTLRFSNSSSSGKYISLNIELEVSSEEQRDHLFSAFQNNPAVTMVI